MLRTTLTNTISAISGVISKAHAAHPIITGLVLSEAIEMGIRTVSGIITTAVFKVAKIEDSPMPTDTDDIVSMTLKLSASKRRICCNGIVIALRVLVILALGTIQSPIAASLVRFLIFDNVLTLISGIIVPYMMRALLHGIDKVSEVCAA
jgi:hypothetical protein